MFIGETRVAKVPFGFVASWEATGIHMAGREYLEPTKNCKSQVHHYYTGGHMSSYPLFSGNQFDCFNQLIQRIQKQMIPHLNALMISF